MEYLGFERRTGSVYESHPDHGYRVLPPPHLLPIRFLTDGNIPPINSYWEGLAPLIFREDSFDPVTKLKRGRAFKLQGYQPAHWHVCDPHRPNLEVEQWGHGAAQKISLSGFERDCLPNLRGVSSHSLPTVILGGEPHITFWRIVNIECNLVGTPVLSLRAKHSLGDTPELIEGTTPPEVFAPLAEALEKVEASVNRLSPIDVIDRCRDALAIAFSYKAGDMTKDFVASINGYLAANSEAKDTKDDLCSWCGRIVARLHPRGKHNERIHKKLRAPADNDADLALNCLKTVLIEFGWAR
jgi:hypothetical protein